MGLRKNKPTITQDYDHPENDLDPRFQWYEGLAPDHLFEEELLMIKELRVHVPQLAFESDKFVAAFLFSRRHGI